MPSLFDKILEFFQSRPVIEDFERAIISAVREHLPEQDLRIIQSQIARFNKSYSDYDESTNETATCFYWMHFGESRQDFPLKWPDSNTERILARARIEADERHVFFAELTVVLGRFFSIRVRSDSELTGL